MWSAYSNGSVGVSLVFLTYRKEKDKYLVQSISGVIERWSTLWVVVSTVVANACTAKTLLASSLSLSTVLFGALRLSVFSCGIANRVVNKRSTTAKVVLLFVSRSLIWMIIHLHLSFKPPPPFFSFKYLFIYTYFVLYGVFVLRVCSSGAYWERSLPMQITWRSVNQ